MAQKKGFHDFLEKSALPLVVIILVPVAIIAYAAWSATSGSQAPAPAPTTEPLPTPTNVTEASIALNNASALPKTIPAAQLVPFSFTVTNTGNTSGTVPYKVYVTWSTGEEDVIDENVATLSAGASIEIHENLKFEIATETAEVYLQLTQTGKTAQFALPRT